MSWKKGAMDLLVASNGKSDIIDVDDLDSKFQNLVILDDFATEKIRKY